MALGEERNHETPPRYHATATPLNPLAQLEHLIRVVASINQDAERTWNTIWAEFKSHVGRNGAVEPSVLDKGFSPSCGWQDFLEELWLLRHYLDSIGRICNQQGPRIIEQEAFNKDPMVGKETV